MAGFGVSIARAPSARARALADRTHAVGVRCARASARRRTSNWARVDLSSSGGGARPRKPVCARTVERREEREHRPAAPAPVQVAGRRSGLTRKPSRGRAAASVASVGVPGGESDFWAAAGAEKGWGVDRRTATARANPSVTLAGCSGTLEGTHSRRCARGCCGRHSSDVCGNIDRDGKWVGKSNREGPPG